MMTFEGFRDRILAAVRVVGTSFKSPDDDWAPMVFELNGAGRIDNYSPIAYFDSPLAKDFFTLIVYPVMLRIGRATASALVSSVWTLSEVSLADAKVYLRDGIDQHPDRSEAVIVQVATLDHYEEWWAEIKRAKDRPPGLGEWEKLAPEVEQVGRMARVPQRALQRAQTLPATDLP